MKYKNIREEELKNKIASDYFNLYDWTSIVGNVDFCVKILQSNIELFEQTSLLWAEAKKGSSNIYHSFVQLILTIGKARTFDDYLPPPFLGAFDGEKIAFIPYSEVHEIFYQNDFNWNITPSNHETNEFKIILEKVSSILDSKTLLFDFENDDKELKNFIKSNFIEGKLKLTKTQIDKNNFMIIYNKWLKDVEPTIAIDWIVAKKGGIIDGDFYLADLLSQENNTIKEKLFVLLKHDHYEFDRSIDKAGIFINSSSAFKDKQIAHTQFWNKYERPPKKEYWDYIIERRDLLVPQDIRERNGSYFTPQVWVELSQKYIADALGENWQEEYFIWDCAAGTGNLLNGLINKYNIWASTLDKQDVEVMHERIKNGANLLDEHVFQFDFLNDDFDKLPQPLQNIINDKEKQKKLIIYINPPYAEADSRKGEGRKKIGVSKIQEKYSEEMGNTKREVYIQFLTRIYFELENCWIAEFSKLKNIQSPGFKSFRNFFRAKLESMFIVPAQTFDNVKGKFPIGFKIWNTSKQSTFKKITANIYDKNNELIKKKNIWSYDNNKLINDWVKTFRYTNSESIATVIAPSSDFQNQRLVRVGPPNMKVPASNHNWQITKVNLLESAIYYTVRTIIRADWINDKDQFLFPNNKWKEDDIFKSDCLTHLLFNNGFKSEFGVNNWIPFTEEEINASEKLESNFMTQFIQGRLKMDNVEDLFSEKEHRTIPLEFSKESKQVFNVGRELWKYYHQQTENNVNSTFYDIREHFQGRDENGRMNNSSEDSKYMDFINELREKLKLLSAEIKPKIYEYGFLKI